ncbi:MAG TPA: delta-60 repeat domain-containing protein [Kofleriaceae bacterium]
MLRTSVLLLLVACGKVESGPDAGDDDDPSTSIAVAIDPAPHYIRTGERRTIAVTLTRTGVTGPVTVEVVSPPAGVTIEPVTIDGDTGELTIDVTADAPFERSSFVVTASAGGEIATAPLAIEVIGSPGAVDPTFGMSGYVTYAASPQFDSPMFALAQGDKVVVGIAIVRAGKQGVLVVRRTRDGAADPTFGITGDAGETFVDLSTIGLTVNRAVAAPQADGRIVIAGNGHNGSNSDPFIARLTPDGQLDTEFALRRLNSAATNDSIGAITIGPSDEIVLAGDRATDMASDALLVRLDATGKVDTGFGYLGYKIYNELAYDQAHAVIVQADGRIVSMISVTQTTGGFVPSYALRRFGSDGQLDSSFGVGGKAALPTPESGARGHVLASPDRLSLVVAGAVRVDTSNPELAVWRFLADGRLDLGFAGGIGYWTLPAATELEHLVIGADDSLYGFASKGGSPGEPVDLWTAHLDANGVPDPGFGADGIVRDTAITGFGFPRAVVQRTDHRMVMVGVLLPAVGYSDTTLRSSWH